MSRQWIRRAHRWVGLFFSLSILMSSGSGVLHNIMSRTQAPPPPARPSGGGLDPAAIVLPIADAIAKLPPGNVQAVNVRGIGDKPWYQIYTAESAKPSYVSAIDGTVDPAQDEAYAAQIASAYLGGAAVHKTDYLTGYNSEYIAIFRVLPVYRFDLDAPGDPLQTRVYVSTTTGSVTRHTDKQRQFEANVFTNIHKLGFIPNKDVRDLVLSVSMLGIFSISLLGVVLFFLTQSKPRKRP